ncbi:MAG: T9SS type A sorting domain-containing protein [Bacteroidales bacterium]|nr:T9SS type A sorting domain-containing protein [Bacteroidales bacterium]
MKRILYIIIFSLLAQHAFSQWTPLTGYVNSGSGGDVTLHGDLYLCISPDNGIYVSSGYTYINSPHFFWFKIWKSHDQGLTWSDCTIPNEYEISYCSGINCIAPSELIGYVWGDQNGIYTSANDGETWSKIGSMGADGKFVTGDFTNLSNGLVLHSYVTHDKSNLNMMAELCKIENGYFSVILIDTLDFRHGTIQMLDDSTGILLCREIPGSTQTQPGNNLILKTNDFGSSWTTLYRDTIYGLNHVLFTSSDEGILVGDQGKTIQTYDGGETWTIGASVTQKNIRFITSKNNSFFCVGDSGLILRKETFLDIWQDISYGSYNYSKILVDNDFIGYIQANNYKILKSDIALSSTEAKPVHNTDIYPNPCTNRLLFTTDHPVDLKRIFIQDISGINVMTDIDPTSGTIDISSLIAGVYLISFEYKDRKVVKKIVKK